VTIEGLKFRSKILQDFIKSHPQSLLAEDEFKFTINSKAAIVSNINDKNLFVRPVEKDISIIRIYFTHELPIKAQNFVNTLMQTYMEECRNYKEQMSDETLVYLDDKLASAEIKLKDSEAELAYYRTKNQLVNTKQETDATLKGNCFD